MASLPAPSDEPVRVALVEDDDTVRQALGRLLLSAGFDVQAFRSAEDYLDAFAVGGPECLVVDLHLPLMNGLSLIAAVRRRSSAPPAVLITADLNAAQSEGVRRAGVDCLSKPVDGDTLIAIIERLTR